MLGLSKSVVNLAKTLTVTPKHDCTGAPELLTFVYVAGKAGRVYPATISNHNYPGGFTSYKSICQDTLCKQVLLK